MADRFLTYTELLAIAGSDRLARLAPGQGRDQKRLAEAAKSKAENEAVSYLLRRYGDALPTAPAQTPQVLKEKLVDLALHKLASDRSDVVAAEIERKGEAAVVWLRAVSIGRADLGLVARPAVDTSTSMLLATTTAGHQVFGGGKLDDW